MVFDPNSAEFRTIGLPFEPKTESPPTEQKLTNLVKEIQTTISKFFSIKDNKATIQGTATNIQATIKEQDTSFIDKIVNGITDAYQNLKSRFDHTIEKTAAVTSESLKPVGHGKAKQLWFHEKKISIAFYTPFKSGSIFDRALKSQERELREEVKLCNNIKNKLFVKHFINKVNENVGKIFGESDSKDIEKFFKKHPESLDLLRDLKFELLSFIAQKLNAFEGGKIIFTEYAVELLMKELGTFSPQFLAVEMREVDKSDKIGGEYTVETKKAEGDLDKFISAPNFTLESRFQCISDFFNGFRDLHSLGLVDGDPKTDNILIYMENGILRAKVSDLGKCKMIEEGKDGIYFGNPRFAPPEGRISPEGEVFSAALLAIRVLEEHYLKSDPNSKERKGIEKFLIENPHCPQQEVLNLKAKIAVYGERGVRAVVGPPKPEAFSQGEKDVHNYIKALVFQLSSENPGKDFSKLENLLIKMTDKDPKQRGDMNSASQEFQRIAAGLGIKIKIS